jgi:Recombination endonuclease VII
MPYRLAEDRRASQRRYSERHPERVRQARRLAERRHPETKRAWRRDNPEKFAAIQRRNKWLERYGLSEADYNALFAEQDGKCAICGAGPSGKWNILNVDHDHVTGQVRGLLCHRCNTALGLFRDDPVILAPAVAYLRGANVDRRPE